MLVFKIYILSAWSSFLDKADIFLLPCPFKYLFKIDCPGCGFQRSLIFLLKGDWKRSFDMYPPAIPLLITFIVGLSANYWFGKRSDKLIKTLYLITGSIVLINYVYKMWIPHPH
ncbi:hypothetical protein N824_09360 [Pedobacter sp. V48]|nr:hypothetical protein N824_09360 [Pedobacter sp. V48]